MPVTSVGAAERPMEEPIFPERRVDPTTAREKASRRIVLSVILGAVALVGGWHYLCQLEVKDTLSELSNEFLREHMQDASALVEIGPVNNVIDIHVELNSKPAKGLGALIESSMIEVFREELEPKLERALHTRTRRDMDVYAMLMPYKVSITVGERDAQSRTAEPSRQDSAEFREVQRALSECGYDIGQLDGVLGPKTQHAIREFRIKHGLAKSSIPIRDFPSIVRQECAVATRPAHIQQLIAQWDDLNDRCRGGSGDEQATWASCDQRSKIDQQLEAQGWCYGHEPQAMADRDWEPCRGGETQ